MTNLFTIIASPAKTFERLRDKGGWVLPFVALTVLSVILMYIQWPLLQRLMEEQIANSQQPMTEEQINMGKMFGQISAYAGAAIAPAISMFLGGLLLLLVNLIVRGEATYMQLAKVSLFSSVPAYIGGIITAVMALTLNPDSLYDIMLTGGAFFDEKKGFLFGAASNILDPFGLWSLALLIIGTSVMTRRSKAAAGIWIALGWLVVKLVSSFTV
ncbi:YIP1 family protein [Paenibacillus alkalitolerans]|uniref:YIP1 family protein n=1 Tax=Paenibacillus alkalitolerans TaxID=2799335 RepID=UPI0018F647E7|nr:YIP1 family protein [Paenibacillus alkalitolerans]